MLPALSELSLLYTILISFSLFIKMSQYYVYMTKQPRYEVPSKSILHIILLQTLYSVRY